MKFQSRVIDCLKVNNEIEPLSEPNNNRDPFRQQTMKLVTESSVKFEDIIMKLMSVGEYSY